MTMTPSAPSCLVPSRRRRRKAPWIALFVVAAGCVLDPDDRCGPNQVIWGDDQRCVCAAGTAYTPEGCVPCAENEVSSPAGCVCAPDYARPAPGAVCERVPDGVGTPCTGDASCLNPAYPHCQVSPLGDGYCTIAGCVTNADCDAGYACTLATPSYCRRPPVGAGKPCSAPADCAGTEALFCDLIVTQGCLEQDCTKTPDSCFTGTECCDLARYNLPKLCVAQGQCME